MISRFLFSHVIHKVLPTYHCICLKQKEAEKREEWKKKGHGEYREITEGDFLGEVTGSDKVICHFYHKEFYRCKYVLTLSVP